jgi:hypothetical protein
MEVGVGTFLPTLTPPKIPSDPNSTTPTPAPTPYNLDRGVVTAVEWGNCPPCLGGFWKLPCSKASAPGPTGYSDIILVGKVRGLQENNKCIRKSGRPQ